MAIGRLCGSAITAFLLVALVLSWWHRAGPLGLTDHGTRGTMKRTPTTKMSKTSDVVRSGFEESCHADSVLASIAVRRQTQSPPPSGMIFVACVGDSITFGNGSHIGRTDNPVEGNYPLDLKVLLSQRVGARAVQQGVEVINYGKSGATVDDRTYENYRRTAVFDEYRRRVRSGRASDLVLVMLGTNDSMDRHWVDSNFFRVLLGDMCRALLERSSSAQLVLMAPPPATARVDPNAERINVPWDVIAPRIESQIHDSIQAVAKKLKVPFIDFLSLWKRVYPTYAADRDLLLSLQNNTSVLEAEGPARDAAIRARRLMHDGIHPTRAGHRRMAEFIVESLCDKPKSSLL